MHNATNVRMNRSGIILNTFHQFGSQGYEIGHFNDQMESYDNPTILFLLDGEPQMEVKGFKTITVMNKGLGRTQAQLDFIYTSIDYGIHHCIITDASSSGSEILLPHPLRRQEGDSF